jgi:hypothetical protein
VKPNRKDRLVASFKTQGWAITQLAMETKSDAQIIIILIN